MSVGKSPTLKEQERNMYREHCVNAIAPHALSSADNLVECIAFVLSTIQTPLARVGYCMDDIRANGRNAASLWGSKRAGYDYACEHKAALLDALVACKRHGDSEFAIHVLSLIPGLGMVKAAFVAQLLGFEASCLDSHNLRRLGMADTALKFPKTCTDKTRRAKIAAYAKLCREHGGAEYWWNSWCEYVAAKGGQNKALDTAEKVSAYHAACFNLT
jgi:hypothetical protein